MRLSVSWTYLLGGIFFVSGFFNDSFATTQIFINGKVLLPVIVATNASPEEREAAAELGRVLEKMSGLNWPVDQGTGDGKRGLYVGRPAAGVDSPGKPKVADDIFAPKPGECGPDAFRVESRDGSIFIEGATPEATGFAVAWFLQHEGGVRWYAPAASGEIIPRRPAWSLPELHVMREPAYVSREITGLQTPEEKTWARHNGLRRRLEFNHALGGIFSPAVLAQHPEWTSGLVGGGDRPSLKVDFDCQPNLALPAVAVFAAETAAAAFAADNARLSFSLGISDTVRFDQSESTRRLVEPLHYFRGRPDYAPLVFTFMNRAAESLAQSEPARYLGCLAYFWSENPPAFPVHPNVVPFVTTDRSQYYDQEYRAADLDLMSRWGASGVRAYGLWEYAYGRGFVVPRVPVGALADSVREGWHRGARGYLAEVEPQWGFDAFKVWMLAQLLWEPDRSIEELADDFYQGYYAAASAPMRHFFRRAEEQWMKQGGAPSWLKYYQQEDQALLFPPAVCRELRGWLEEASEAAKNDPAARAHVTQASFAFAVTETYTKFDSLRREIASLNEEKVKSGKIAVSELLANLLHAESDFRKAFIAASPQEFAAAREANLSSLVRNDPVPRVLWLASREEFLRDENLPSINLDAGKRASWTALAELRSSGALSTAPNLMANSSFAKIEIVPLEPRFLYPHFGPLPAKWKLKALPTERGMVRIVEGSQPDAPRAVRIEGAWDTQLYQWIPVEPNCTYVATAKFRGKSSAGSDAGLFLAFIDETGTVMNAPRVQLMPKGIISEPRAAVLAGEAIEGAAWVGVGVGVSRQSPGDWLEASAVELRGVVRNGHP